MALPSGTNKFYFTPKNTTLIAGIGAVVIPFVGVSTPAYAAHAATLPILDLPFNGVNASAFAPYSGATPSLDLSSTAALTYDLNITGGGWINFYTGHQKYGSTGTRTVYVNRSHGTSGAASVDYTVSNGLNGAFSSASTGSVTWADGQGGLKAIVVTTSAPSTTGPSWVHVSLSNPSVSELGCREYVIVTDDGSVPPDSVAIFCSPPFEYDKSTVNALAGSDTTGDGTQANPYASVSHARTDLGGAKQVIVMMGGAYKFGDEEFINTTGTSNWQIGMPVPSTTGLQTSHQTRCYIMGYPGQPHQLYNEKAKGSAGSKGFGFIARNQGGQGDYCTLYNIEISNNWHRTCSLTDCVHAHVISCYFHDGHSADTGVNVSGVFVEILSDSKSSPRDHIISDNRFHDFSVSDSYTDNNSTCVEVYHCGRTMVSNNTMYAAGHGMFWKAPVYDTVSWHTCLDANLMYDIRRPNEAILLNNDNSSGNTYGVKNSSIVNNLIIDGGMGTEDDTSGPTYHDVNVEHNTFVNSGPAFFQHHMIDGTSLGNVWVSGSVWPGGCFTMMRADDDIKYFNYNLYNPSDGYLWGHDRENSGPRYTTFPQIQAAFGSQHETEGINATPAFVDSSNGNIESRDYRLASGSRGRADVDTTHDGQNRGSYYVYTPGQFASNIGGSVGSEYTYDLTITGSGWINFYNGAQKHASAGTRTVYVNRSHGTSGISSVDYTVSNGLNGAFSSASTGTVTWVDGEGGLKAIEVTTSAPSTTGPSWVHVSLSNPSGSELGCREYVIVTDDGSVPPDSMAIFTSPPELYDGSTANPNAGNDTTGDGTQANPYASVVRARDDLGGSKQIVVLMEGTFFLGAEEFVNRDGPLHWQIRFPRGSITGLQTSHQTRCYFMGYPGQQHRIANDTGGLGWMMIARNSSGEGDYCTLYNIEAGDNNHRIISLTNAAHPHVIDCYLHDGHSIESGVNVTGVFDETNESLIVAGNVLHDFSVNGSFTDNNSTCVETYHSPRTMVSNNTMYAAAHGYFWKAPVKTNDDWHCCVHSNKTWDIRKDGGQESILLNNDNNGGYAVKNSSVVNNLVIDGGMATEDSAAGATYHDLCFEHNTSVASNAAAWIQGHAIDTVAIGNVWVSGSSWQGGCFTMMRSDDDVKYVNYNIYNPSDGKLWLHDREQGGTTYTTFPQIQSTFGAQHVTEGINAAPAFVDSSNGNIDSRDYRLASGSRGRADVDNTHDGEDRGAYFVYVPGAFS